MVEITDCIILTEELKKELLTQNPDIYLKSKIGEYAFQVNNVESIDGPYINGKLGLWNLESLGE